MYAGIPLGLMIVLAVALIAIGVLASKRSGTALRVFAGAILLGLAFTYLTTSRQVHVETPAPESQTFRSETFVPPPPQVPKVQVTEFKSISNEELWEQLTKERIVLDEEQPSKQPAKKTNLEKAIDVSERPQWVDDEPKKVGSTYRTVVYSDPFSTVEECYQQLEQKVPEVVLSRVVEITDVSQPVDLSDLEIGLDYVFREICTKSFIETRQSELFEAKKVYVQLEFTQKVDEILKEQANIYLSNLQERLRDQRLLNITVVALLSISALAAIYCALKFDTWTRGYYTKQLIAGTIVLMFLLASIVTLVS